MKKQYLYILDASTGMAHRVALLNPLNPNSARGQARLSAIFVLLGVSEGDCEWMLTENKALVSSKEVR